MLCCDWLVFNSCYWYIPYIGTIFAVLVGCSLSGLLFRSSPIVVLLEFQSTIPVDVLRVKSYATI